MGGQVGVKDHTNIGDHVRLGAQSGVARDIGPGEVMLGSPALPHKEQLQIFLMLRRLPQMREQFKSMLAAIESIQSNALSQSEPGSPSTDSRRRAA
jgi:UDP-3-O-[3-hydroxymyristoyl] glucosamine N-acyltransferase